AAPSHGPNATATEPAIAAAIAPGRPIVADECVHASTDRIAASTTNARPTPTRRVRPGKGRSRFIRPVMRAGGCCGLPGNCGCTPAEDPGNSGEGNLPETRPTNAVTPRGRQLLARRRLAEASCRTSASGEVRLLNARPAVAPCRGEAPRSAAGPASSDGRRG